MLIFFKKNILIYLLILIKISVTHGQNKPNIVWLVCEDQSLFFSSYGDHHSKTPNIDELSKDGIIYDNCFTTSPVCSPSRSALITGMYPTTIGTQHMRAFKKKRLDSINKHNQLPFYSAVPKRNCQFFTEILRTNGYYCSNNSKEDYNMMMSPLAWDESSKKAHWRNRKDNQPFFSVFNFNITHESQIWKSSKFQLENNIKAISLPKIFPNNKEIKKDFLTNYKNIESLDSKIGSIIKQLKNDGIYDNTVIFFFSDHGGPFPRYKRSIYDTGIKCPLIIKWLKKDSIQRNNQMISFIDFAPTLVDLAGLNIPKDIEGVSFLNKNKREYIFAATDRFDETNSKRRCVRNNQYKLIRNFDTLSPLYQPISYRYQMRTMKILDSLKKLNQLSEAFKKWYDSNLPTYELYNIINDPFEQKNLIHDSSKQQTFEILKTKLEQWINSSDYGNFEEREMIGQMWPNGNPPMLKEPKIIDKKNGKIIINENENSSLGWRNNKNEKWKLYKNQEIIQPQSMFETLIFKMGYQLQVTQHN